MDDAYAPIGAQRVDIKTKLLLDLTWRRHRQNAPSNDREIGVPLGKVETCFPEKEGLEAARE